MDNYTLDTIIDNEILIDTYNDEEVASAWYSYMEDHMGFPFEAECLFKNATSPLKVGESVDVTGLGEIESCDHKIHIKISFCDRKFDIPLLDLKPVNADDETLIAIRCWYHWLASGNQY
jgi:hypothetical protein